MKFDLECRVCGRTERHNPEAWRTCLVDRGGNFTCATEVDIARMQRAIGTGMRMRAYVCGQMHALVLFERFLDRGTFEPLTFHEAERLAEILRAEEEALTITTEKKDVPAHRPRHWHRLWFRGALDSSPLESDGSPEQEPRHVRRRSGVRLAHYRRRLLDPAAVLKGVCMPDHPMSDRILLLTILLIAALGLVTVFLAFA